MLFVSIFPTIQLLKNSIIKIQTSSVLTKKCGFLCVFLTPSNTNSFECKEYIFFEGAPSKTELIIPFISILTVIGIFPFILTLMRQFWVSYKITNRRISVKSGFKRNQSVEIVYRDIKKIKYVIKFAGLAADLVVFLKDGARVEIRNLPNWKNNISFIKTNCLESVEWN